MALHFLDNNRNHLTTDNTILNTFTGYDEKKGTSYDVKPLFTPSEDIYGSLIKCFREINRVFFDNKLQEPVITLQRKGKAFGYFSGDRFIHGQHETLTDEIALNPAMQAGCSFKEIIATLAHECCHMWQFHWSDFECRRGTMRGYHDKEWGEKMISIGLMPSHTGEIEGRKTGRNMSHYIIKGGVFDKFVQKLIANGYDMQWQEWVNLLRKTGGLDYIDDALLKSQKSNLSKTKFTCKTCNLNAWAKPSAKIACYSQGCSGSLMHKVE